MEMKDYQIDILLEGRNFIADRGRMDDANHINRRILRYLSRLLFAIGWEKLRLSASQEMNQYLVTKLFAVPTTKKYSVEPGTMGIVLKECAKMIHKEDLVKDEFNLTLEIGDLRNDDAHEECNREEIWGLTAKKLEDLENYFKNKECDYLVPIRNLPDGCIQCDCYSVGRGYPRQITVAPDAFTWSKEKNHVFYRMLDRMTGKTSYYNLSPFIEKPQEGWSQDRLFLYFHYVKDKGYGQNSWTLLYYSCEGEKTQLVERSYQPLVLFSQNLGQESKWYTSPTTNLRINISQYPGYEDIRKNGYKYCSEICPIQDDVIDFCKVDDNRSVVFVSGNGGVGKTALMLSVISNLFSNNAMHYTNLIFLSAKLQYIGFSSTQYSTEEMTPDIHNYDDLIGQLAELTDCETEDVTTDELAERIVERINESSRRFLLIIDDLDSLDDEEQKKIDRFVYRFKAEKLKTIITTRAIRKESSTSFYLKELDSEKSLLFAKWYYNSTQQTSWERWLERDRKNAEQWVTNLGEGNPLIIQMIIKLVTAGAETYFNVPRTRIERCKYRYNTVQNILDENEQLVFQICIQIYEKLEGDKRNQELSDCIPRLLAVGCGIDQETFNNAKTKLRMLSLLVCSRNDSFKVFSDYFLTTEEDSKAGQKPVRLKTKPLPKMYRYVWKSIQEDPQSWFGMDIASRLARLLLEKQNEPHFDIVTARTIFEEMIRTDLLTANQRAKTEEWMNTHNLTSDAADIDASEEVALRRMSELENTWDTLKNGFDTTGAFDVKAVNLLVLDVIELKKNNESNPNLKKRCDAILEDPKINGFV